LDLVSSKVSEAGSYAIEWYPKVLKFILGLLQSGEPLLLGLFLLGEATLALDREFLGVELY